MSRSAKVIPIRKKAKAFSQNPNDLKIARIILSAIKADYRDTSFFTREDLLQLRVLQSVATITRYRMVCEAIQTLQLAHEIERLSRTEFCLFHRALRAHKVSGPNLLATYAPTVKRLILRWDNEQAVGSGKPFDLVDLLGSWTTDPHLSTNAKRVAIRESLRRFLREKFIRRTANFMTYEVEV